MSPQTRIGLIGFTLQLALGCSPNHKKIDNDENKIQASKPVAASFESIQELIISQRCVQCHSGSGAPHKIDLSSYETILNNNLFPPLIVPGQPDSSSLYESIKSGRMPKRGPALPAQAVAAVRDWIAAGAPKDQVGSPLDDGTEPPDDGEPSEAGSQVDPREPPDDF